MVDDGSPDKCPKICDEYAKKDKRVRVIHKENAGLVAARNTGIKEAKGDYICYVDGDDWISENLLQIVWSKAVSKYDVEMVVYSAVRQFTDAATLHRGSSAQVSHWSYPCRCRRR